MATLTRWCIWLKMVLGKSNLHLNQPIGNYISVNEIRGYYNDLSEKVTCDKKTEKIVEFTPVFTNDYGKKVIFPIQIIQYALGCYELYLKTNNALYLNKAIYCTEKILTLVNEDGSISCMYFVKGLENPYSAMCQGECISLLFRLFKETNDKRYYYAAIKVYDFLVDKENKLAVTKVFNGLDYCLFEYPEKEMVLNGYIFALFGIYDAYLMTKREDIKKIFDISLSSLKSIINEFDCDGWSYYDLGNHYASKFYHKLHIDLLSALNLLSNNLFDEYIEKWRQGINNKKLSRKMFWKKAKQKLKKQ